MSILRIFIIGFVVLVIVFIVGVFFTHNWFPEFEAVVIIWLPVLGALATTFVAFLVFANIVIVNNQRKEEKKELLLKELIGWANDVLSCWFSFKAKEASPDNALQKYQYLSTKQRYIRYLSESLRSKYGIDLTDLIIKILGQLEDDKIVKKGTINIAIDVLAGLPKTGELPKQLIDKVKDTQQELLTDVDNLLEIACNSLTSDAV